MLHIHVLEGAILYQLYVFAIKLSLNNYDKSQCDLVGYCSLSALLQRMCDIRRRQM